MAIDAERIDYQSFDQMVRENQLSSSHLEFLTYYWIAGKFVAKNISMEERNQMQQGTSLVALSAQWPRNFSQRKKGSLTMNHREKGEKNI